MNRTGDWYPSSCQCPNYLTERRSQWANLKAYWSLEIKGLTDNNRCRTGRAALTFKSYEIYNRIFLPWLTILAADSPHADGHPRGTKDQVHVPPVPDCLGGTSQI